MGRPRNSARTVKETEIKLITDSDSLAELKRNPNLRGREASQSLVTTYFDTRDRRLAKAGVRLRLRTGHGKVEQTIKTNARDGPSFAVQLEKTCLLDRPKLDIKAFPKSNRESLETLAGGEDLREIATTKVERLQRTLERNGARIELAFDFGTIEAAGHSKNISELELELKRGNLATLLQFIRDLPPGFKLAWSSSSKCARAFDLADGLEMAASKAVPVSLKSDMLVRTAFQAIAWNCLGHLINNYLVVIDQRDAEAVHQCRVALRRLRVAASIFGRVINERPGATLRAQWKAVAESLGQARIIDVLLETITSGTPKESGDANLVLSLLKRVRDQRYGEIGALLGSRSFQDMLLCTGIWIETNGVAGSAATEKERALSKFAAESLQTLRSRVEKDCRRVSKLGNRRRHRLRIRLKSYRYGTEFFSSLFQTPQSRRHLETLLDAQEKLQDRLGELNDLSVFGRCKHIDLSPLNAIDQATVRSYLKRMNRSQRSSVDNLRARTVHAGRKLTRLEQFKWHDLAQLRKKNQ
ncbi:CHAD domain-containing protein [Aquisediminimonas profunda]|uniref:CYTH and CHAD domain-containing protein n=1 Tax=Aquisediminimonas profunda TaxID=1550733 RepID=UPI001C627BF1|nr:CHAD domain-containing protein [Aquisediminimonas profunda]